MEGRTELEREFRRNGIELTDEELKGCLENIGRRQNCTTEEDVYAAIVYCGIQLWKVMPNLKEE